MSKKGALVFLVEDLLDGLLTGRTALSHDSCPRPVVSNPFSAFGDLADYFAVPGGTFATPRAGWELDQDGAIGAGVLMLRPGAVAISPKVCVGDSEPTLRMMMAGAGRRARLRVDALFVGTRGDLRSDHVTTLSGGRPWGPSPIVRLGTNTRAAKGEKTAVAFVLTAQRGTWLIDDLYVDPFRSR